MKSTMHFVLLLAVSLLTAHAAAQPTGTPITIGEQLTIESTVLGEERSIIVGLPAGYEFSDASYPVLYLLDGSQHFHYTTGITEFLAANQFIPQMIVIAVNNTDRRRDLTPPSQVPAEQRQMPTHGGADNFKRFLADELMPWIDQNYRTHPYRVLSGHSLGGLFAVHTLTTQPNLFDAYIAISPSMHWNAQHTVEQAEQYFSSTSQLPVSLYMTAGDEGAGVLGGVRKLAGVLDTEAPRDFLWRFDHMPTETHGSVPHRSMYQGLEFVFANWALRNAHDVYTHFGMEAISQFYAFGDQRYGFSRGIPALTLQYLVGDMVRAGDLDGAVELLELPSAEDNAPASLHAFLARALLANGDQAQAARFYRNTLKQNPGDIAARNALDEWNMDYSDIVPQPHIDPDILRRYEAVYISAQTAEITVFVEEGQLYREMNETRLQLHPISDTEFYLLGGDVRYNFQTTETGAVGGVRIRQGEAQVFAERL